MAADTPLELAHAVLDRADLGQVCGQLLDRSVQELKQGGFQLIYSSQAGVAPKRFGAELLICGRFAALDGSDAMTLCVRLLCNAKSSPAFLVTGVLELHRHAEPGWLECNADTLLNKLTLAYLPGPVDSGAIELSEEFARARGDELLRCLTDSCKALPAGEVLAFVEEVLAP